jgi:hypothetical protein
MATKQSTRSTRVTFHAKHVKTNSEGTQVTLEFPGLEPVCLEGMQEVKLYDPVNNIQREFTDEERLDFEQAVQIFVDTRLARALKKYIRFSESGAGQFSPEEVGIYDDK